MNSSFFSFFIFPRSFFFFDLNTLVQCTNFPQKKVAFDLKLNFSVDWKESIKSSQVM